MILVRHLFTVPIGGITPLEHKLLACNPYGSQLGAK
jgi:hypothetical protein